MQNWINETNNKFKRYAWSLGDIITSKVFVSLEIHDPSPSYCFGIGKPFNKTRTGLIISIGCISLLAHIR